MLVLSRKVGETIVIGDGIRVSVLKVTGQRILLGIEAPECVSIVREELVFDPVNATGVVKEEQRQHSGRTLMPA